MAATSEDTRKLICWDFDLTMINMHLNAFFLYMGFRACDLTEKKIDIIFEFIKDSRDFDDFKSKMMSCDILYDDLPYDRQKIIKINLSVSVSGKADVTSLPISILGTYRGDIRQKMQIMQKFIIENYDLVKEAGGLFKAKDKLKQSIEKTIEAGDCVAITTFSAYTKFIPHLLINYLGLEESIASKIFIPDIGVKPDKTEHINAALKHFNMNYSNKIGLLDDSASHFTSASKKSVFCILVSKDINAYGHFTKLNKFALPITIQFQQSCSLSASLSDSEGCSSEPGSGRNSLCNSSERITIKG